MRTVLLVPRRADQGHRDALWAWCRRRWRALLPDVRVYEGHHDEGPFNRSAAINRAALAADADGRWDVALVVDADIFLATRQVRAAIESATQAGRVTWAHRRWRGLHERDTLRVVADPDTFGDEPAAARDMDLHVERTTPISWSCCIAIPRAAWNAMGGMDERFLGWGFEDGAWAALVRGLYPWARIDGDIYHLWHARSQERIVDGQPAITASPDYIRNALLGRRYMVAALRDHKVGDLVGQEHMADADVAVNVKNLKHDDMRFQVLGRRLRLPEAVAWRAWWPTLEELQAGATEHVTRERQRRERGITLIVRSGGSAEMWPTRRRYLERSIVSLVEHVGGSIVQRVLFSDWPARAHEELGDIAERHGFYVVGGPHRGYTGSMQGLWAYISRRAIGRYVFLAEDDFTYDRVVDLDQLVDVLVERPNVTQVALLRHPAYQSEIDKGGILGWPEASFNRQRSNGHRWLEHRNFWTANPSLFRRTLTQIDWPSGASSERLFAESLFGDTRNVAAFWGEGEAQVRHIGELRAGVGY